MIAKEIDCAYVCANDLVATYPGTRVPRGWRYQTSKCTASPANGAGLRVTKAGTLIKLLLILLATTPALPVNAVLTGDSLVQVEAVESSGKGHAAGLAAGDSLLAWQPRDRESRPEDVRSPFDFADLEDEWSSRAPIEFSVRRNGQVLGIVVARGRWGIRVRPTFGPPFLDSYLKAERLARSASPEATTIWNDLASELAARGANLEAAWLLSRVADAHASARHWETAGKALDDALREARVARNTKAEAQLWASKASVSRGEDDFVAAEAHLRHALQALGVARSESLAASRRWNGIGFALMRRGQFLEAERAYGAARAIEQKLAPAGLDAAETLNGLGEVARRRGRLEEAEPLLRGGLAIREKLAPDSVELAGSLRYLARTLNLRGNVPEADKLLVRAIAILEVQAPGTLDLASSLSDLGLVREGDLAECERLHRRALAIREAVAPQGLDVAASLNNVGRALMVRGDLAGAESLFRRSLSIKESLLPESLESASTLMNIGLVGAYRGDFEAARIYYRRSLTILEIKAPDSNMTADARRYLAEAEDQLGHRETAEGLYAQALATMRRTSPGSEAETLSEMALMAYRHGDLDLAERLFRESLPLKEKDHTNNMGLIGIAEVWNGLGDIQAARGSPAAEESYKKALDLRSRVAPGTQIEAETMHALGLFYWKAGRTTAAVSSLAGALEALEAQNAHLGGAEESRSGFARTYASYYRDDIDLLVALGRNDEAFHVLERSRARNLLDLIAERDLVFDRDIPAELEHERKTADADYESVQAELRQLSPQSDAQDITRHVARLHELRARQLGIAERIKEASPRLGSLHYPKALDLAGVQAVLDPQTAVLAYSVSKDRTTLFALPARADSARLLVRSLPIGETELRDRIEAYRYLIDSKATLGTTSVQTDSESGRALYEILVRPVESVLNGADRVLVLPDGPLHVLPFSALVRSLPGKRAQYLVEWKPIHIAISATVYAELEKERKDAPRPSSVIVAAFGDPKYLRLPEKKVPVQRGESEDAATVAPLEDIDESEDPQVHSVVRGGFRFEPLPESRAEVENIASLYAPKAAVYLGSDATEEQAKSIGKDVPLIHFATHAVINERFPLDSALVFTIPEHAKEGQDNGLLQAWEIFERVRIDADLVTLSACESGLGKEMGGEGLIGLTRAFQYAGARSVLASLWRVEDKATAELMKRFYRYLKAGNSKDQALRLAQIDLIHSLGYSQPKDWAAFQLNGDWK